MGNINVIKDGPEAYKDNPTRLGVQTPANDRSYHRPIELSPPWQTVVAKTASRIVVGVVLIIGLAVWKWGYCADGTQFVRCEQIDNSTPLVILAVLLSAGGLWGWQWVRKQENERRMEEAEVDRMSLVPNMFGDWESARLLNTLDKPTAVQLLTWRYKEAVELKKAVAPSEIYWGVNNLTEGAKNSVATDLNVAPQLEAPKPTLPTEGMSIEQMVSAGYVRGSDYSLLLGLDDKNIPVLWNWSPDGTAGESMMAIAGAPGMGKTYAAKLLLAVAAYKGIRLVLCDPQGEGNNKQTLLYDAKELKDAFFAPPAIENREILLSIARVYSVMEKRMKGQDKSIDPILLVIDEFSYLMTMNEHMTKIVDMLTQIGRMGRKYNIRVLLIGQSWRSDVVGGERGTTLRNLIRLKMIFGIDPMEVRFLTSTMPQADLASIAELNTGHALVYSKAGKVLVTVPTTQNDLMAWAGKNAGKLGVRSGKVASEAPDELLNTLLSQPAMDYAMAGTPENGQNGHSEHSIVHSEVDVEELARELFAANLTQREAGDRIRARGLKIDQREMPRLQREALGKK